MLKRYSSRRENLGETFLNAKLKGASSYDRIAGYFSSSILEIAGEAIEQVEGKVRVICNSTLNPEDIRIARESYADLKMKQEWCDSKPEENLTSDVSQSRLAKLYKLLSNGKLEVRVIPNEIFGLMHGKAGVITYPNGDKTCFIGSINETKNAYTYNYEIAWEDTSPDSVTWVQDEFNYFWNSQYAIPLCKAVITDIDRISKRVVIPLKEWRDANPEDAIGSATMEEPVCRQEFGLWEHQKYFVERAFREHKEKGGARLLLADMVGLGKTIELAMSAKLMGLCGDKPILIIVPKTLIKQWQEELKNLLDLPSAIWDGREWIDENGYSCYDIDPIEGIKHCPRKIGIISQGIITRKSKVVESLKNINYECVILDEAHRARRTNTLDDPDIIKGRPNNLLDFITEISKHTKSMLLATATPMQINPIEVYDLLNALGSNSDADKVLGTTASMWHKYPARTLSYISGDKPAPDIDSEEFMAWNLMRNPFPLKNDGDAAKKIRERLDISDTQTVLSMDYFESLKKSEKDRIKSFYRDDDFIKNYNPYIRCIVRRTRSLLETKENPDTKKPYLKKIELKLFGENDDETLCLTDHLGYAYHIAEDFCHCLGKRVKGGGFMSTLLLKRIGSSMLAGEYTAKKMLRWSDEGKDALQELYGDEEEEEIPEEDFIDDNKSDSEIKHLTVEEIEILKKVIRELHENNLEDPKYQRIRDILKMGAGDEGGWKEKGCILFSQYYDTARDVAIKLSLDYPSENVGLYAGGNKSGLYINGEYKQITKDEIKHLVKERIIKILVGTDAASEGLNLQTLSTLINIDLPWNPTRLEQRKGRIQRIGQISDTIYIYNLTYKDSVEDRVHKKLSDRLQNIFNIFGQIPDVLEDVWVAEAIGDKEKAETVINKVREIKPFIYKYERCHPSTSDWAKCVSVLSKDEKKQEFLKKW